MKITYIGPHDAVDVPAIGVVVERGESVDVDAVLAKSLLAQSTNWSTDKKTTSKEN